MRVILPAALREQQQQQQQATVHSPTTSSVDTAVVCNKSDKKRAANNNNTDDEFLEPSLQQQQYEEGHSNRHDIDTIGLNNEEAKRPASSLSLQSSETFNNNNYSDDVALPPVLDERKIAAKTDDSCITTQPNKKPRTALNNNYHLDQEYQQSLSQPLLKSCQGESDHDWKHHFIDNNKSTTTKDVGNMGGGGKLISGPPPSKAISASSLRQASIPSINSNQSNNVTTSAVSSNRGEMQMTQQQQRMTMVAPSMAASSSSATTTAALLHQSRRRGDEERVGAASMPSSLTAAASRGSNNVASVATLPQPHDDDNEDGDEWSDNNNGKLHASNIFIHPPNNNLYDIRMDGGGSNHSSRRGGYKTSSSPRSSSSVAAAATAAATTAPLLNRPIPGSIDDPATMSKSDVMFLPSSTSSSSSNTDNNNITNLGGDPIISKFVRVLQTHKPPLEMVEMEGDGNCLFRAISLQVYGDQGMHADVRKNCLDFMEREVDHFQDFVADEGFHQYIARKRQIGVHGNHNEIQAMSELYNRSIEVFVPHKGIEPINIFHEEYYKNDDADPPIRLCYMDGNHYNALIDPLVPTAGLGLGLPGLQPGLADKLQMEQAKHASNESALDEKMQFALKESNRAQKEREEREMKEVLAKSAMSMDDAYQKKALYLSEIEAADFDLEQAVLASSIETYRTSEQERKPSSRRLGVDNRRNRFNSSPRGQRSSSNSPIHRSFSPIAAANSAASTSQYAPVAAAATASSTTASYSRSPSPNVASAASMGGVATAATLSSSSDEYPASVQELVMNGFELRKVLRAYDLIGDNFDDLLSFLLSQASS